MAGVYVFKKLRVVLAARDGYHISFLCMISQIQVIIHIISYKEKAIRVDYILFCNVLQCMDGWKIVPTTAASLLGLSSYSTSSIRQGRTRECIRHPCWYIVLLAADLQRSSWFSSRKTPLEAAAEKKLLNSLRIAHIRRVEEVLYLNEEQYRLAFVAY